MAIIRSAAAFISSLVAITLLALTWHSAGWAEGGEPGYLVTSYFTGCIGFGFIAGYLLVASILGCIFGRPLVVALGMLAPLPIAFAYECARDPTSHNLIPFEVAIFWVPAFALAFGAAVLGARLRGRLRPTRGEPHEADPRGA